MRLKSAIAAKSYGAWLGRMGHSNATSVQIRGAPHSTFEDVQSQAPSQSD